jgi:hypothetical protein
MHRAGSAGHRLLLLTLLVGWLSLLHGACRLGLLAAHIMLLLLVMVVALTLVLLLLTACCCLLMDLPLSAAEPLKQCCQGGHPAVQLVNCLF